MKPLTPPRPPAEGSGYIEDAPSPVPPGGAASAGSGSGRLSAIPAPLPTPTPSSSPLASGAASTPSAQRPSNKVPSVQVFDEIEHVCQANDSFKSISEQYFMGSDAYAKALQRHNQNHARASKQMETTGKLTPGEKIYVPQAYILEQRYPDAIDKPARSVVPASGTTDPPGPPASGTTAPPSPPPNP
ncbi:MAG TPA: hypothetical protein VMG10_26965 [Gemmataceae bacterium]|nr:hypothetical protein [Gemmataceae bacterium]